MADTDKSLYNLRYNQINSTLEAFGGGAPQWTQITLTNVDPTQVPVTRQINTTAPLQGGGNLTADRTLSIPQATSSVDGYLLAADWITFNTKLTGVLNSANIFVGNGSNVAVGVPLSGDATLSNTGVLTFNTVNGNVGTFTNVQITVNAKGLITAASSGTIGNLTDAGTDGITVTGGIGAVLGTGTSLSQHVADSTHNGYLSSTDWTRFNSDTAGITALTGDVTATGPGSVAATLATVNANTGSFGSSTSIPNFTVNGKGLITAAGSNVVIAPAGTLTGTTLASNVVSSSLTSVGTIAAGVWNGTAVDVAHGGTGDSSFTAYSVITGGTTSTGPLQNVSGVGTSGQVLTSNGAAALPTWQPAAASGTVNTGIAGDVAYYATSTNAVSATAAFTVGSNGPNGIITGTNTNDTAATGKVGEVIEASQSSVSIGSGAVVNITSISLTAGDWDILGAAQFSTSTADGLQIGISLNSTSFTGTITGISTLTCNSQANNAGCATVFRRVQLSGTTTVYLPGLFNNTTHTVAGGLSARRAR